MAATSPPQWVPPPPPPSSSWSAGRVIALVLGIVLLLPGLGLLAGGGLLLWADTGGRSDDGYLTSSSDTFSSQGFALVSDSIDLSTGADWLPISSALGDARIQVTGTDPGADVFIGIAPVADVSAYLNGVGRDGQRPAVRAGARADGDAHGRGLLGRAGERVRYPAAGLDAR
jgi:hypothetical protein